MPNFRKRVRDGMYALLSNGSTGFNAQWTELLSSPDYSGLPSLTVDWTPGSRSFIRAFLTPDNYIDSQLSKTFSFANYTSEAKEGPGGFEKFRKFSGLVNGHLDAYWVNRLKDGGTGLEIDDTESQSDAVEDAVLACFNGDGTIWPNGVAWNGEYSCARDPLILAGDGWLQRIPMTFTFEVNI